MSRLDLRQDGFALGLLVLLLLLLVSGLAGAYRVFGYALVALLGLLAGVGFVRRGDRLSWLPPVLATSVLLASFTGMFARETAVVRDAGDTVLGFQPGTAFLVYGVWLPAFFTMAVSFALLFDRLAGGGGQHRARDGGQP